MPSRTMRRLNLAAASAQPALRHGRRNRRSRSYGPGSLSLEGFDGDAVRVVAVCLQPVLLFQRWHQRFRRLCRNGLTHQLSLDMRCGALAEHLTGIQGCTTRRVTPCVPGDFADGIAAGKLVRAKMSTSMPPFMCWWLTLKGRGASAMLDAVLPIQLNRERVHLARRDGSFLQCLVVFKITAHVCRDVRARRAGRPAPPAGCA